MSFSSRLSAAITITALGSALFFPSAAVADSGASDEIDVRVTIPQAESFSVTDAQFRWGVNTEVSAGSFSGDCNFLSAGIAGDAGASRVWAESDGLYKVKDGNSHIEKPDASGEWADASWDNKCLDATGRKVGPGITETGTGTQAVIEKGVGKVDPTKGTAHMKWKGSFSIVFYGGLTYWSLSDPELTVANGHGTLTATASGYAADRDDTTKWRKLSNKKITIAKLPSVALGAHGIVTTPAYKGVKISAVEPEQSREQMWWGSFPKDWVEYNQLTGQGPYWYSSGGAADSRKVATDIYISYTPENSVIATPKKPQNPRTTDDHTVDEAIPLAKEDESQDSGQASALSGPDSGRTPVQQLVHNVLSSVLPQSTATTGTGTSVLDPAVLAASTISWMGKSLIPEAIEQAMDYKEPLLWSLAGLLALGSVAWVGFRHGWLVWPFSSKK